MKWFEKIWADLTGNGLDSVGLVLSAYEEIGQSWDGPVAKDGVTPRIRKVGLGWVCRDSIDSIPFPVGVGISPRDAYNDWAKSMKASGAWHMVKAR